MTKYYLVVAALLLSVVFALPVSALAQQAPLDVTVSPVFFDFTAKPGDTINERIRVRNNTASELKLKLEVSKMGPGTNGELVIIDPKPEDTYINWLKLDSATLDAKPQEWTDLGFSIAIPQEAAFGYYWIIQIKQDNSGATTGGANISGAAAVPVLLNVQKDGATPKVEITDFSVGSFINQYLPVSFKTKLTNTGNVHLKPRGNIFISGQGQTDLAILDVNQASGAILPQASRTFDSSWTDGFLVNDPVMENGEVKKDTSGQPVTSLKVNWDKFTHFRFGPYTATLVMVYDDGQKDVMIQQKTNFWVIPYAILAGGLVGLGLLIFIIKLVLTSYIKSQLKHQR